MQIEILYQDDDMLMVNKPAGILVIPDRFNSDLPVSYTHLDVYKRQLY